MGIYRCEKLIESEEKGYQEQRRRLQADHAKRIKECEKREAAATADKERCIKQAQEEFEDRLQVKNFFYSLLNSIIKFQKSINVSTLSGYHTKTF